MTVTIAEVTMVAPDIIRVEAKDAPISYGTLVQLGTPDAGAYEVWLERTNPDRGDVLDAARVCGKNKDYLKFQDIGPTAYLDRVSATDKTQYGSIGGRTVDLVTIHSLAYQNGQTKGTNGYGSATGYACSSMRHYLYLKLSGSLAAGSHSIVFPSGTGFGTVPFTFNDKVTRSSSIHATHIGHRASDKQKIASLSMWVPGLGENGAINFGSYSMGDTSVFHIIDQSGTSVFSGTAALRSTPTQTFPNDSFGNSNGRNYFGDTTDPWQTITGITCGSSTTFTVPGHGFSDGTLITTQGITGDSGILKFADGGKFLVASGTTNTFIIKNQDNSDSNSTGDTWLPNYFIAGHRNRVKRASIRNLFGTYTYWLDYSAWTPSANGQYRVWIPGLGVSDEFIVHEAVYHGLAKHVMGGVTMHRMGCELDGRFGITRPAFAQNGVGGFTIKRSIVPSCFTEANQLIGGATFDAPGSIFSNDSCYGPWNSGETIDASGEWMDAGDWDCFTSAHGFWAQQLLFLYDALPSAARVTSFNTPHIRALTGNTLYPTALPDILEEVAWYLESLRRTQAIDGSVYSGMDGTPADKLVSRNGQTQCDNIEPSWLSRSQWYVWSADHFSCWTYASIAAHFSVLVRALGHTALADTYLTSAIAAHDWAEDVYNALIADPTSRYTEFQNAVKTKITFTANTNGNLQLTSASSTTGLVPGMQVYGTGIPLYQGFASYHVIDTIVGTTVTLKSTDVPNAGAGGATTTDSGVTFTATYPHWIRAAGWDNAFWNAKIDTLTDGGPYCDGPRLASNGGLYRAVTSAGGDASAYKTYVEAHAAGDNGQGQGFHGNWNYYKTPGANSTTKANVLAGWTIGVTNQLDGYALRSDIPYKAYGTVGAARFSEGFLQLTVAVDSLWRQFGVSLDGGSDNWQKCLQAHTAYCYGANQLGIGVATGYGPRGPDIVVHEDSYAFATGVTGAVYPGIVPYAWSTSTFPAGGNPFQTFGNGEFSYLNQTCADTTNNTDNFTAKRIVEPTIQEIPSGIGWWQDRSVIIESEYTVGQTMTWNIMAATYLHGWDGNAVTTLPTEQSITIVAQW